jgi:hypothetical protein
MTDEFFIRNQLRSLQSVDRAVGEIVDKVAALGKLDETVFIFTSDNGYLWGEHGLWGKGKPYEEALLVPFVIMMPGIAPRTDEHFVGANLDIGATVYDLANIQRQTDGMSLVPLLQDPATPWRSELYFESFGNWIGGYGLWASLRDEQWKYTELGNGEHELYDLLNDPYELESQHDNPLHAERKSQMASRLGELKGLAMVPINFVTLGRVSRPFDKQLSAWGGSEPYIWTVYEGRLPEGLSLNAETGLITGLPQKAETRLLRFMVKSADRASHKGEVQSHISKPLKFVINP